jgi:ATP-binding cassette subfamily F protein 1
MSSKKNNNTKKSVSKQKNLTQIQDYKNFTIDPIDISFGKLIVLQNTKLSVQYGEHYGLIGKNGIGKTSLLNAIANRQILVPEKLDMIYVKQEEPESERTVIETLLASDEKMYHKTKHLEELEILVSRDNINDSIFDEYNNLSKEMGSEHLKQKIHAQKLLLGLGFDTNDQIRKVSEFSGGWRMRISLAKALFMVPTLLILDEPTNHLDLHANIWLTEYLKTYPKTILLVSHDKFFIDEVCTIIIHIHDKKLNYYRGNYELFQKQIKLEQEKIKNDWLQFEKKIVSMRKTKKTPSEIDAFIKSSNIIKPEKDYAVKINFLQPNTIRGSFAKFDNVSFGYEKNNMVFEKLNLVISANSRIAIVGKNGVGKSTLLKLLVGELIPTSGEIIKSSVLKIGYYNQHFEESMPFEINGVKYLMDLNGEVNETLAHKYLSLFGLEPEHHKTILGDLSGGQKARVKFASFGVTRPHLLILDEPSNHLDIVAVESLINALNNFEGAIILVTHNFDIITSLNSELWVVGDNELHKYLSSYDEYIQRVYEECEKE